MKSAKLKKIRCEVEGCGVTQKAALHYHHIIERKVLGTSNEPFNLAVLCATHHELTHDNILKIIGVFPSTGEQGRTLVYELNGVPNIPGLTEAYYKPKPAVMKVPGMEKEEDETRKDI